jgi:hypothetical protein
MKTVSDILRDADPLRHESHPGDEQRNRSRRAVLLAGSSVATPSPRWVRTPMALLAVAALIVSVLVALGSRTGPHGATVYAAVRFEVRLAEERPAAGLREARVSGSDRVIYLHEEVVVTNADIEQCALVPDKDRPRFDVGVRFNAAGAEKMQKATAAHMGQLMAVLIDGEVVMAPVIRSVITTSAVISGNYSQAEAERIVNGIGVR